METHRPFDFKSNMTAEQYFEALEKYQKELNNYDTLTVLMQVGDFYECYGLEYENGKTVGNLWDICGECLGLQIGKKNYTMYKDPSIKVFMSGIPITSADKWINKAVDLFGWTIVLISQQGKDKDVTRYLDAIISPGTNLLTDNDNNTTAIIYLDYVRSKRTNMYNLIGTIAYINSLTGESAFVQHPQQTEVSEEVIFDELLKMINISNPGEIVIYCVYNELTDDDIVNRLHLNDRIYKINRTIPKQITKEAYQLELIGNIFFKRKNMTLAEINANITPTSAFVNCPITLAMLLEYIIQRNPSILERIQVPKVAYDISDTLVLANNALEQLNIINTHMHRYKTVKSKSVLDIMNKTKTHMGSRLLRERIMNPISNEDKLNLRYDYVGEYMDTLPNEIFQLNILKSIRQVGDLKRIHRKFYNNRVHLDTIPVIYATLKASSELIHYIKSNTKGNKKSSSLNSKKDSKLEDFFNKYDDIDRLDNFIKDIETTFDLEKCNTMISKLDTNPFNDNYNTDLMELQLTLSTEGDIIDELRRVLTDIVKKPSDKDKMLISRGKNTQNGHYICASPDRATKLEKYINSKDYQPIQIGSYNLKKDDFFFKVLGKGRIQIIVPCVIQTGGNMIANTEQLRKLVYQEFRKWCSNTINIYSDVLLKTSDFIAELDLIRSCAIVSKENAYVKPNITKNNTKSSNSDNASYINATGIRHPLVEKINTSVEYIKNNIVLGTSDGIDGMMLYGVNASGKSNLMKAIGVNIVLAQAGCYVACDKFDYVPFKYLFTRILNNDNIYAGMSSFQVEMTEFKTILKYANQNSIVLGDELCHGTETNDAASIVAAGVNILSKRKTKFIFATHLHILASDEHITSLDNVCLKHMTVKFDENNKKFIYERKLKDGNGPMSYGITMCQSMNLPSEMIELANEVREKLTSSKKLKKSKYNKSKYLSKCEVCNLKDAVDTHHIKFQSSADKCGMIGTVHKNDKFNLVGLCKDCHNSIHSSPNKLNIDGYIQTSDGFELDYNWL